jgi:hypothetical protein
LKCDVEPETVAIKRQRGADIPDDEERRDAGNLWVSPMSFHRRHFEVDCLQNIVLGVEEVSVEHRPNKPMPTSDKESG